MQVEIQMERQIQANKAYRLVIEEIIRGKGMEKKEVMAWERIVNVDYHLKRDYN